MVLTPDAALKSLKTRQFAPLYLLHGDEPYYLDQMTDFLAEHVLPPPEQAFNQFVLFGKELSVAALLSYAKRYPMLAERQLVLVKEAQGIAGLEAKDTNRFLEEYALKPLASTVLVLCFKEPVDERKSWVKAFDQKGIIVNSRKLYDNKLPDWIAAYCHDRGVKISPKAMLMLAEFVGGDLKRLASELDKMFLNLRAGQDITAEAVETYVGVSKEYNSFEFQKALFQRDAEKAYRIAAFFAANPKDNPLQPIVIVLYNYFSKLLLVHAAADRTERALASQLGVNPYFVKDYLTGARNFSVDKTATIIAALRRADGHSKGVDTPAITEGAILNELVYSVLH
ncbi:MAG: DNA polymerase III subunit delta [Cytophagaceae bacterium]|nr:DNA polymerase III subunit delta [Cytophagaceae bacterium]